MTQKAERTFLRSLGPSAFMDAPEQTLFKGGDGIFVSGKSSKSAYTIHLFPGDRMS